MIYTTRPSQYSSLLLRNDRRSLAICYQPPLLLYKHVSVRNNAEESAFYDASLFEEYESNKALFTLLRRQLSQTLWKYLAQFFQNFFDYYGGVLSYLIQVIPIFILNSYKNMNHDDLAGLISNNAFFFITLISSCTRLTDLALSLGEMAGYTQRCLNTEIKYQFIIHFLELKCCNLSLKTRVSGIIIRNTRPKDMMYLPQRPYFPVGQLSLRQQIVFPQAITPNNNALIDNGQILKILHSLSLNNLIGVCGGLNENVDFEWYA
uniref:ABC transmembrane type-1 domain-containing protein n=1 Tax=Heterorhabditis bacteriophora TaxID=37862 RepID=A0A1I7WJQ6_HETBA